MFSHFYFEFITMARYNMDSGIFHIPPVFFKQLCPSMVIIIHLFQLIQWLQNHNITAPNYLDYENKHIMLTIIIFVAVIVIIIIIIRLHPFLKTKLPKHNQQILFQHPFV